MYKVFPVYCILLLMTASCEFKTEVKTPGDSRLKNGVSSKIRNGIVLKENNLTASQAFLLYDDGTLVPETNEVKIGQKIKMRLVIDGGFKEEGGKIYLGASENIQTNDGKVLLDEKDLFSAATEGVSKEDAGIITLSAEISSIDKLYDYFLVSFRVWDKKATADVTGSYKLYIK